METSPDGTKRSGHHARPAPLLRARGGDAAPPQHRAPVPSSREGTRARAGRPSRAALAAGAAGAVVVVVAATALLTGGDDTAPPARTVTAPASAAASPSPSAAPSAPQDVAPPPVEPPPVELSPAVLAGTGPDRTAADARAALEEVLTARADANLELLRSEWQGDAASAASAAQDLALSSEGLVAVVTTWQDAALAERLRTGFDRQSEASRAYAVALAAGDPSAADRARGVMGEVSRGLGAELARVTDGRIASYVPPQDAARYRDFVDALAAGDTAAAQEDAEWLRARLGREGAALAAGLSGGGLS